MAMKMQAADFTPTHILILKHIPRQIQIQLQIQIQIPHPHPPPLPLFSMAHVVLPDCMPRAVSSPPADAADSPPATVSNGNGNGNGSVGGSRRPPPGFGILTKHTTTSTNETQPTNTTTHQAEINTNSRLDAPVPTPAVSMQDVPAIIPVTRATPVLFPPSLVSSPAAPNAAMLASMPRRRKHVTATVEPQPTAESASSHSHTITNEHGIRGGRRGGRRRNESETNSDSNTGSRRGGKRGGGNHTNCDRDGSTPVSASVSTLVDGHDVSVVPARCARGGARGRHPAAVSMPPIHSSVSRGGGIRVGDGDGGRGGRRGGSSRVAARSVDPARLSEAEQIRMAIAASLTDMQPKPAKQVYQPAASSASTFSRFAADQDGVFTLITGDSTSSSSGAATTKPKETHQYDPTPVSILASTAPASASRSADQTQPDVNTGGDGDGDGGRAAAEMNAWFHADSGAGDVDPFEFDEDTTRQLESIASMLAGDIAGIDLTQQQASVLRYLVMRSDSSVRDLLHRVDGELTGVDLTDLRACIDRLTVSQVALESQCRDSQLSELEALHAIFDHTRELVVFQTHPICLKLTVALQEFDCNIELGFRLTPTYPIEPITVTAFIPPPYQGLKIPTQDTSDASQHQPIDSMLQRALDAKARDLIGEPAIYACVDAARSFMEAHGDLLKHSLEQRDHDTAGRTHRVLTLDSVQIFGRGRIERLEYAAIKRVQEQLDLNESMAKAKLIAHKWDVEALIRHAESESDHLPPTSPAIGRHISAQARADAERFDAIQACFHKYVIDPTATLQCSACFDDFQLREVAGHVCGHAMCITCWRRMLRGAIRQGESNIKCIGYKCRCTVEEGLLMTLLAAEDYRRYRRFLQDSFIKLKQWKWCVNPRCNNVASVDALDQFAVVSCHCHALWCFSCGRDGHWPISCTAIRSYESSRLVQSMRQKVESRIGAIKQPEEHVQIDVKKCPKCGTPVRERTWHDMT